MCERNKKMSTHKPVGFMRLQRQGGQGCDDEWSGEEEDQLGKNGGISSELESSTHDPSNAQSSSYCSVALVPQTWPRVLEDILWVVSTVVIVYVGDWRSNLISLLFWDDRIRRTTLYLGLVIVVLNAGIIFYTAHSARDRINSHGVYELLPSVAPLVTVLGLLSHCLFSYALWPIWRFLSIPLLFTLFMCFLVVLPYLPLGALRPQTLVLRAE